MSTTESRSHDDASGTEESNNDTPSGQRSPHECHETVDPETRREVLATYEHRCQSCGRRGPEKGGLATLHVHHIERDPDEMSEHDLENLTLLCRSCHTWLHQQSTPEDSPVEITEADQSVLLPQDIEILRYLAEQGPTRTGDIVSGVPTDLSVSAVRERLWVLMGLDNLVESRDQQIVDKDVETGEWGLTEQVENSARGHIPDDPQLLLQRMEDEQVRQALERGCDRSDVIEVLGVSRRTTFNKHKRACAYDFPLDAFARGGRPADGTRSEQPSVTTDTAEEAGDEQQRLDAVADQSPESGEETGMADDLEPGSDAHVVDEERESGGQDADGVDEELRGRLQQAIDALQEVDETLRT
ncbi:HNH endonuclease [Salarchaeum sp. JOR-1]|uniref:HNH endonuclease n=1 Tax=Salarchaeum sp. JOR-1 TaxID=2599399 RepID=UPI001198929C|nr:HNH endonuclease signature motif containing protein [Salarchaeum sp. JOR-1]QDX41172.1 HNH endonuclease [Salarchaeum sp. JOR-1]